MATDGAGCEAGFFRGPEDAAGAAAEATKREFDVDTLSKPELRMLLSVMEGELEARDLVIEALRARRKEVFVQERYGRFNLNDPFLALQRDYETGAGDKEKKPVCTNPLSILEAVMGHCRKMQERMSAQLAAAESRQKKLEMEKLQLQALEQEQRGLASRLEEERAKNKHVVLMLVKECKQLSGRAIEEAQKLEEVTAQLDEEKKKAGALEEQLSAEKRRSADMEAQMEKQLSELDTEREQLRAKLHREEAHSADLREEIDKMKKVIEQLKRGTDSKPGLSLPRKAKDRHWASVSVGTEGPLTRSAACQADLPVEGADHVQKPALTVPGRPPAGSPRASASAKGSVCSNAALLRPAVDRQASQGDLMGSALPASSLRPAVDRQASQGDLMGSALPASSLRPAVDRQASQGDLMGSALPAASSSPSANRIEENGPSAGSAPDVASSTPPPPSPAAPPALQTPGACPPAPPVPSPHPPCATAALHPGLNPRVQAARFRFQGNANDPDQNGNTAQSPPSRDVSPTSRDNLVAKQLARNTVAQALSRFTGPQAGAPPRPGAAPGGEVGAHPPAGRASLKTPGAARVDRGNPPPIPPKKPGLSQAPSPPHPQLKGVVDGSRASSGARADTRTAAPPPPGFPQGSRVMSEEHLPKSSSPQLPPKPSIDLTVAPTALATSQKIHKVKCTREEPSCWPPSLTPLLTSGGPAPLAGRPTLLQQAAAQGNATLLPMLLNEEGLDINYSCEDGHSALYSAAKNGHTDCVRLLLNAEAQVNAADGNGFTPSRTAAAQGHFKRVELLLASDANMTHAADGGQTPLYLACKNGNKECIRLLLEAGTDRRVQTRDGWTPVHTAVDTGHVDSLKLLMYHRAPACGKSLHEEETKLDVLDLDGEGESTEGTARPVVSADLINHAGMEGWTAATLLLQRNCLEIPWRHGGLEPERREKCGRTAHDVATDDRKHLLENLHALKVPLRMSVGEIQPGNHGSDDFEGENTIRALSILRQTPWDDFSKAVSQAPTSHVRAISSDERWSLDAVTRSNTSSSSLGLSAGSVQSIMLGNAPWSWVRASPSPVGLCKRTKQSRSLCFCQFPQEGCLGRVTFTSMIPLQMLQNYLRLLQGRVPSPCDPMCKTVALARRSGASSAPAWPAWAHLKHFLGQSISCRPRTCPSDSESYANMQLISKEEVSRCFWFQVTTVEARRSEREGPGERSLGRDLSLRLNLDQRLCLDPDAEADLVREPQGMCSSQAESGVSTIAETRDGFGGWTVQDTPLTSPPEIT